jgi:CRP-like cAMP-binding protein
MSVSTMIKGYDLFRSLPVESVERISRFSSLKKYEKGETVYKSDIPATHLFMLVSGLVYLRLPARNYEFSMIVSRIEPPYLFGLAHLMGGQRYTVTAECAKNCEVLAIEAKPLQAMLQENLQAGYLIMSAVAKAYSERYMEMLKRLQEILNQIAVVG